MHLTDLARELCPQVRIGPVPLLVLRLPQLERIAWREGKRAAHRLERSAARAFALAARQSLRTEDLLAHDPGSDAFVAAILATPRAAHNADPRRMPNALDCRAALERIAAGMTIATELTIETGWTLVRKSAPDCDLSTDIANALERGMRERERYEFFATVGHELRTPLTSIRGYLETLLERPADAQTTRRFLETARREALRLERLVANMFDFSLLDLSATAITATVCDLARTVETAFDVVRPLAAARDIRLINDVAWATLVGLDEDACVQALINLFANAIKYGRQSGCVRVGVSLDLPFARITVDDDGPGVAALDREKIFGLRVRGTQQQRPGTGIGLAIVRMIAERAGGEISVCASPLGGARFELLLPVRAEFATPVS